MSAAVRSIDDIRRDMEAKFGPPRSGPLPPPSLASVGVGWSVWERVPDGTWYDPRGGTVDHIVRQSVPDPDGELVDRFVVVRIVEGQLHWISLRADQLAPVHDGNRPNASSIRGLCQVAARALAAPKRKPDDEGDLELWSLGARLMAVIARPAAVSPSASPPAPAPPG